MSKKYLKYAVRTDRGFFFRANPLEFTRDPRAAWASREEADARDVIKAIEYGGVASQCKIVTFEIVESSSCSSCAASSSLLEFTRSIATQKCSGDDCEAGDHDGGICDPCAARGVLRRTGFL